MFTSNICFRDLLRMNMSLVKSGREPIGGKLLGEICCSHGNYSDKFLRFLPFYNIMRGGNGDENFC